MITVSSALSWAEKELENFENGKLEARVILSDLLSTQPPFLSLFRNKKLNQKTWEKFKKKIEERKNFIPFQYIRGFQPFFLWDFKVKKNVFIPRQETEVLIEYVLKLNLKNISCILDMCCGNGAIGITLAKIFPECKVYAVDISSSALKLANENSKRIGVENIFFLKGSLFEPLKNSGIKFDLIISNPPYIPKKDWKDLPEDVKKEPKRSLIGGCDGILFHKKIISQAGKFLKNGGFLILEVGISQKDKIISYAREKGIRYLEVIYDYQKMERGLVFTKI
jgi:release factor glutamine methyltransferase